jgi:mycofactocin system glycosyltransferase
VSGTLPDGFGLALDRRLLRFGAGTVLAGGRPGRIVTLSPDGAAALDALAEEGRTSGPVAELAGRLIDAGMAHPRRGPSTRARREVTVVVPVRDRPGELDRCLTALGPSSPVVVVDDASRDPGAVARVCGRHGARLVSRPVNGGPGAARAAGLERVGTELVAFVDSDCTVPAGWLSGLTWLFDDPSIGAVAPRVRPAGAPHPHRSRAVDRYADARSALDLGPDEGEVGPDRAVRYVPTAALVARREAVVAAGGFDPGMRVGEDVDLVWRLVEAGWRVRYQPEVTVTHAEPGRWSTLLARRARYGTSAGPLAARHPGRLAPVELRPLPTLAAVAALAGRPVVAGAAVAVSGTLLARTVRPLGVPGRQAWVWSLQGAGWTVVGLGRAATMVASPALAALAARGHRGARAALVLVLVPPVVDWLRDRPDLDLPRWVAASVADDLAYGIGVWLGCVRARDAGPLVPAVRTG